MERISVIVPVYNVQKYLDRCVDSIVKQTYPNLEIILVDDGSKDNSGTMCDGYTDSRIKVIHKANAGLGMARNSGIEMATGQYIMFVDSDDYIDLDMIEKLYSDLIKAKADTAIGGFKRVFSNHTDNFVNPYAGKTYDNDQILTEVLPKMMGKNSEIDDHIEMSAWKVLFSADIIKKNKLQFPSEREFISEDIIFDTEYYPLCSKIVMSSNIGYNYCDNEDSLTTRYNPNRFKLQKKLYLELSDRTKKLGIAELSEQRLMNTFVANTRYCIKLEEKFNSFKEAQTRIRQICDDSVLSEVLQKYNVKESKKSQAVNFLISKRLVITLHFTMKLKNKFGI